MEPPDGCPAEVYDIMRQVYIKFLSVVIYFVSYCIAFYSDAIL